ncbi:hypothetical protein D3C81_1993490 [compost metagenome]
MLVEANGIGHRHQFDHTVELSLLLKFGQAFLQLPGGTHARQFVGVQAGLDVDLAGARAITKHAEGALGAQVAPGQWVVDALHGRTPDLVSMERKHKKSGNRTHGCHFFNALAYSP